MMKPPSFLKELSDRFDRHVFAVLCLGMAGLCLHAALTTPADPASRTHVPILALAGIVFLLFGFALPWWMLRLRRQRHRQRALTRGPLINALAREMRAPLNGITGYAEYIGHHATDPMIRFTGTIIFESSHQLLRTMEATRDLIRAQTEGVSCTWSDFSLVGLLDALHQAFASGIAEKNILLITRADETLPATLRGPASQVHKIMADLTENAIRFCEPQGRVELQAGWASAGELLELRVTHDGPALPAMTLERMLQDASQSLSPESNPLGDAGIRLAVASQLAQVMGGQLRHLPTEGRGNTFVLTFPLAPRS